MLTVLLVRNPGVVRAAEVMDQNRKILRALIDQIETIAFPRMRVLVAQAELRCLMFQTASGQGD